jgi:hypothetical protein
VLALLDTIETQRAEIERLTGERDEALSAVASIRRANDAVVGLANRNNDARLTAEAQRDAALKRVERMREALAEIESGPIIKFEPGNIQFNERSPIQIARAALTKDTDHG